MKLSETLQLIKAGFTAKEIRELNDSSDLESNVAAAQNTASTDSLQETETDVAAHADDIHINIDGDVEKPVETVEKPIDYKALYEKSQAELKAARKSNLSADFSGNIKKRDLTEDVKEIFRR